jgi:hypothetical protein
VVAGFGDVLFSESEACLLTVDLPTVLLAIESHPSVHEYPGWHPASMGRLGEFPARKAPGLAMYREQEKTLAPLRNSVVGGIEDCVARFVSHLLQCPGNDTTVVDSPSMSVRVVRIGLVQELRNVFHQDGDRRQGLDEGEVVVIELIPVFFEVRIAARHDAALYFRRPEQVFLGGL